MATKNVLQLYQVLALVGYTANACDLHPFYSITDDASLIITKSDSNYWRIANHTNERCKWHRMNHYNGDVTGYYLCQFQLQNVE